MGLNDLAFGADGPGLYDLGLKDSGLNDRGADRPVTLLRPHQAANKKSFEDIEFENDLANFLPVHLANPYLVNMTGPQQTGRHSPQWTKKSGFPILTLGGMMWNLPQQVGEYVMNR